MRDSAERPMTVDEFMRWDDGTDTRYELDEGVPMAMAPPAGPHSVIVANATGICWSQLRGRSPCRTATEFGIRISTRTYWQADLAVVCSPLDLEEAMPSLIVEVLSPTTRTHDLGRKLLDYQSLPAAQEIWLIDSERRWLQHWRREGDHWRVQDFVGSSSFPSPTLEGEVPLDELYRNSGL